MLPPPLRDLRRVLAVVAHPDDESFGLGGIVGALVGAGVAVDVLCFTRGEASTLGRTAGTDLGAQRAAELAAAGEELGVDRTELHGWPDGELADADAGVLEELAATMARETGADAVLVFDESGVTGHPDHRRATAVGRRLAETEDLALFAWVVRDDVAEGLNAEFGTTFVGHAVDAQGVLAVPADRARQRRAIARHVSQATDNPVLWRRLALSGATDHVRQLRSGR